MVHSYDSDKKIIQQREHYANIAGDFDAKYNRENSNHYYKIEEIESAFLTYLPESKEGWDFMEVGAGSGIHAKHFVEHLGEKIKFFLLSDLSEEMLDNAKQRLSAYSNIGYLASPAESIPIKEKFDGIYVSGSMHHFTNYKQSIINAKSHLKENGIFVICEPNVWNPINFVKAVKDYSLEVGQFTVTRKNVCKTLVEQNFEILSSRVLHYRGESNSFKTIYPYRNMEKFSILNLMSTMFLVVARNKNSLL
jgi:ubiquinone/menaquinone biosynthesis C-methylase UbiE